MDGAEVAGALPAEVMVQSREESAPPPALLGVTVQESVAPLKHPPAALPSDSPQKRALSSLPAPPDALQATTGPALADGSDRCLVAEDSSCVPQTPPSKARCETPPSKARCETPPSKARCETPPSKAGCETPPSKAGCETPPSKTGCETPPSKTGCETPPSKARCETPPSKTRCETPRGQSLLSDPPPCMTSISQDSSPNGAPLSPTPGKGPKKRGRKPKAKVRGRGRKPASPPTHPPGRKGLGIIQPPLNTAATDSPQKRALSSLPPLQDSLHSAADPPPLDIRDKSFAADDRLLQTPVKVPKKRGRKSKAELLQMKAAQELSAPTQVENRQSDSENMEVELTQSGRPRRRAAKTAMKYFQDLADEWSSPGRSSPKAEKKIPEESGKKRRRKRKADDSDDDVDYVLSEDVREEEEEVEDDLVSGEESDGDLSLYRTSVFTPGERFHPVVRGSAENGLHNSIMAPLWSAAHITMDTREAQYSDWEYPEWIPQRGGWCFLSHSEAEIYLPQQKTSPPFCIRREGIKEDSDPHVLDRFQSLPPHPQRFDGTFFVGGPVWSLDWCPTLWGSNSCQYVALYCHHGMDDRHKLHVTHTGPALLQLWRLGVLSPEKGVDSAASFSYGLAIDDGCIWDLKFCPSGGWEPPGTPREGAEMARLGLLAVAFSSGHVQIYSLPHPEALNSKRKSHQKGSWELTICKVDCVVRLHVGSIKACSPGENGQCFTVAWLPSKPHQYLAAGFYDGTVAIWDLKTTSVLQRVRQGGGIRQYPFHSFSAHDNAVRSIEWCKADSNFFVTCGNDRRLKFWDLRRLHAPVNNIRRFQSTEITWLLPYCGVAVAQDNCYASHGLCGIHYVDSGFLGYKPYFATPRKGTVWSVSGSDWLGSITSGDLTGEVMVILLPSLNVQSINAKRPSDRRFPVYKVDFHSCAPLFADSPDTGDHAVNRPLADSAHWEHFKPKSFRAAAGRFSLQFQDMDTTNFRNMNSREPVKRMQANELKGDLDMERVQLEAIHKVRFNPNLDSYTWIVSGGHSGLVRVHCVRGLLSSVAQKMIQEKRAKFQATYEAVEMVGESEYSPEVRHCVVEV